MGVLTTARVRNEEPSLHGRTPESKPEFEQGPHHDVDDDVPPGLAYPLLKRDSIQVQKSRPVNDDEAHEEVPSLEEYMIPRRCGRAAPPAEADEADAAGGASDPPRAQDREGEESLASIDEEEGEAGDVPPPREEAVEGEPEAAPEAAPQAAPQAATRPARKPRRNVNWGDVLVRDYDMTLGDHPCCSYGPPVALSWDYLEYDPVHVDEYEFHRAPRRGLREMQLNYYARRNVLELAGVGEDEWRRRAKEVGRARTRRQVTASVARNYPLATAEAAVESARRKFKRLVREGRWRSGEGRSAAVI